MLPCMHRHPPLLSLAATWVLFQAHIPIRHHEGGASWLSTCVWHRSNGGLCAQPVVLNNVESWVTKNTKTVGKSAALPFVLLLFSVQYKEGPGSLSASKQLPDCDAAFSVDIEDLFYSIPHSEPFLAVHLKMCNGRISKQVWHNCRSFL